MAFNIQIIYYWYNSYQQACSNTVNPFSGLKALVLNLLRI